MNDAADRAATPSADAHAHPGAVPRAESSNPAPRPARPLDDLARRLAKGEREAFEHIHARLNGGLLRLFTRRGASPEHAEELAQATWTEIWQSALRGRYDPERAAISTFVYAVAQRVRLRRPGAAPWNWAALDEVTAPAASPSAEQTLSDAELLEAARACLGMTSGPNALSEDERAALVASFQGLSERQTADNLKVAASTVNARKKSAYEKIRRCLNAKGFSTGAERGAGSME